MNNFLNRVWRLRAGELNLVLILGFVLLSNSLAQKVSEIASISNFLSDVGTSQFLPVLIISSIISIFITGLQSLLIDRFDRVTLLLTVSFSLGLIFLILRILFLFGFPEWLNYGLLYLLSDLQFTFFPLAFWILANDIYEPAQAQRLFPIFSTWSLAGNLLGLGITALSPALFEQFNIKPEELLMLNILVYLVIYIMLQIGFKNIRLRSVSLQIEIAQETLNEGWKFIQEVPAFKYLTLSILAVIVCERMFGNTERVKKAQVSLRSISRIMAM